MIKSAYIHIPFCVSKCKYCSFVSYSTLECINDYVLALLDDIQANYYENPLSTLYIGGGTPSLLPTEYLAKIISKFNFNVNYEFTVEVNPDDVSLEYFIKLKKLGVNRISIGSQCFNDRILKLIGRRHNSDDIRNAVKYAKDAGFSNISLDLIYGLPTQNLNILYNDIENFLDLDIQHISTYGLKIDSDSGWGKFYKEKDSMLVYNNGNKYLVPDDDMQADMYEFVNDKLEKKGFFRYEVSNFSKNGFESRHNINYWNNSEYYAFGAAAHGYVNGCRFVKYKTLQDYIKNPCSFYSLKKLTIDEKLQEEIFLGFRKREGINSSIINEKFGIDFELEYKNVLEKYSDFFIKTNIGYSLNLHGVLLSNIILAEFI